MVFFSKAAGVMPDSTSRKSARVDQTQPAVSLHLVQSFLVCACMRMSIHLSVCVHVWSGIMLGPCIFQLHCSPGQRHWFVGWI